MDAGYFRSLIVSGCALQLLGVFATLWCTQYWQLFLAQGLVQGLGNRLLFTPTVVLVSTYFSTKRAFALGLTACGASTGGVVFPLISCTFLSFCELSGVFHTALIHCRFKVARQLSLKIGFPWTVRVMGFLILLNTVACLTFARPRLQRRLKGPLIDFSAFLDPVYSLFAVGIFLALWGLYFAYYYVSQIHFLSLIGLLPDNELTGVSSTVQIIIFGKTLSTFRPTSDTSLTLLMLINGIGIAGRLIPALLADYYFGAFNTLIPCIFSAGVLLFVWIAVTDLPGLFAFTAVCGFWANAVQTLFPSTLSSLTTDLSKIGVRVGMVFTIISVACLTGPPIAGALIQSDSERFLYAQVFGGSTMLCGAAILVFQVRKM